MGETQEEPQMKSPFTIGDPKRNIKLRQTRRIYDKWGIQYYTAMKDAIFGAHILPYKPLRPSSSLFQDNLDAEIIYMCQQCQDCFWFESSFKEHSKRCSWVLGYWCKQCFFTMCTHVSNRQVPCDICIKQEYDRRKYLKTRGIDKRQKKGSIRVFYNSCQFFAHLKSHNITLIDLCDIMLMPLPNMEEDWSSKISKTCEALMEYCFMKRTHVMDWLRINKMEQTWWKLNQTDIENTDNPVARILKTYNARELFGPDEAKLQADLVPSALFYKNNRRISEKVEDNKKHNNYNSFIDEQTAEKDKDNASTFANITFVDCGPVRDHVKTYKTKLKHKSSQKRAADCVMSISSSQDNSFIGIDNRNSSGDIVCMPLRTTMPIQDDCTYERNIITNEGLFSNNTVEKIGSTNMCNINLLPNLRMQTVTRQELLKQNHLLATNSTNVLTLQGVTSNSLNLNVLIKQLPSHFLTNNKMLLINKGTNKVLLHSKQENCLNKKLTRELSEVKRNKKSAESLSKKLLPLRICNNVKSEKGKDIVHIKKSTEFNKTTHQIPIEGKVVYQNGRRYIITQSINNKIKEVTQSISQKDCNAVSTNDAVSKIVTSMRQYDRGSHNVPLPIPSPSSDLSNGSSNDMCKKHVIPNAIKKHSETSSIPLKYGLTHSIIDMLNDNVLFEVLSFYEGADTKFYLDIKHLKRNPQLSTSMDESIPTCRQNMLDEFQQLNRDELTERLLHMRTVKAEISRVMNFAKYSVEEGIFQSVKFLLDTLEEALAISPVCSDTEKTLGDPEIALQLWESQLQHTENKYRCATCNKIMKPKEYIPGFSKSATNDSIYCSCYKHFCYECDSYQGNVTRFLTHQNFHEEDRPYACPDCFRRFPSFRLLEHHSWTVCYHMLKKRIFCCTICEIEGFQDLESITRHFAIMHSYKRIACEICNIVLHTYKQYDVHHKTCHPSVQKSEPIKLVVCKLGQCVNRYEKFMAHLEKHCGTRKTVWLKCPFCPYMKRESKQFLEQFKIHFTRVHCSRLPEIIKPDILKDIFPTAYSSGDKELGINNDKLNSFTNAPNESCADGTVLPKIVNTRTISSEVFEQNSESIEDEVVPKASANDMVKYKVWAISLHNSADSRVLTLMPEDDIKDNNLPKILDVRSITNISPDNLKTLCDSDNEIVEINGNNKIQSSSTALIKCVDKIECTESNESHVLTSEGITKSNVDYEDCKVNVFPLSRNSHKNGERVQRNFVSKPELKETSRNVNDKNDTNVASAIDTVQNVQNAANSIGEEMSFIPKPPPLTRIPQYILDKQRESKEKVETKETRKGNRVSSRLPRNRKVKKLCRIALNGPTNSKEQQQIFSCHLCGELISTYWPIISNHFSMKHSDKYKLSIITPRLLRVTPEFIDGGYRQLYAGNNKRKSDSETSSSKKKKRNIKVKKQSADLGTSSGLGIYVQRESVEDEEGNFVCKRCEQRCSDILDLRKHIANNHRIKDRYLVCLECGENFVVAPSLQMHLKAYHEIDDPILYMSQNPSYAPDDDDDPSGEARCRITNQCYVCTAAFEDKAAMDKHLRVHGMAFLNRKRIEAQNALKCPQQNAAVIENKQSPPKECQKESVKRLNPANTILEKINASIMEKSQ